MVTNLKTFRRQDRSNLMPSDPAYRAIGRRLRAARERAGFSQEEAGETLGVTDATISRYEKGTLRIAVPDVERLARLYSVAAESILTEPRPERRSPREIMRELEDSLVEAEGERPIMVHPLSDQRLSAGEGAATTDEPLPYYPGPGERGHRFVWVQVVGDCMEPEIHEGYIVIVDLDASPIPGKIVAARHEGEAIVKRFEKRGEELWLVPLKNKKPVKVNGSTQVLGVVVFTGKRV